MFCPKCRSAKLENQEFEKKPGEGIDRHCVEVVLGVHPHARLYGVPPDERFFGVRWNCQKCGYVFYARKEAEANE